MHNWDSDVQHRAEKSEGNFNKRGYVRQGGKHRVPAAEFPVNVFICS